MPVEFGVLLPTREAIMSGRPETAPPLAMAERAGAAGCDSEWIGGAGSGCGRRGPHPGAPGRAAAAFRGAASVTLALDPDPAAAEQRLHGFLETYYAAPAGAIMARQACYAGPIEGCVAGVR